MLKQSSVGWVAPRVCEEAQMGAELPSQLNLAGSGFARMRGLGGPLSECSVAGVSRASLMEGIKLR